MIAFPRATVSKIHPMNRSFFRGLALSLATALSGVTAHAIPAFPGAEGFGAQATGGRGGSVYLVTNLNDSGAGSFRDAVSVSNRTVVFAVGGIIRINSPIAAKSNITIAGQTAPGEGITVYGNHISFSGANNTIARYVRFREGIVGDSGSDAVGIASGDMMIFDHVSASWGRDETFSVSGTPSNITLQDCLIGQGLLIHSAGGLMQTSGGVSVFRCFYADNWMRNPKVKGVHDFTNNVVYNWGSGGGYIMGGDSAGQTFANIINNYFIDGPNTVGGAFKTGNLNFHAYANNNLEDNNRDGALNGVVVSPLDFTTADLVSTRYPYPAVARLLSPEQAYQHIITYAGASLHRDRVDALMIQELTSLGTTGAQITNENQVGGPGPVAGGLAAVDTDGDGMPDWWEQAAGLNPLVADNNGDANGDGYTNLENYINAIAVAGVPGAVITGITPDSGSSSADGVTSSGSLVLHGTAAPSSTISLSRADIGVIGSAVADGSGQWSFDYAGTPLADRYYAFTATATVGGTVTTPSAALVVKVDSQPAAVPVITSIVAAPTLAINGSAEPGSLVQVTLEGSGVVGTATADGLGNWSAPYTGTPLSPGPYSFTATATDVAGNVGPATAPYLVDTSLASPVLAGITTDSGASSTDRITNDTTLVFNGTALPNATVTLTRAGVGVIGSTVTDGTGTWTFDYTAAVLASGTYTFSATANTGGSSSPASEAFVVTIDRQAPTISSIRRQAPSTAATVADALTYRVTFAEPVSGVDLADFALTFAGATGTLASITPVTTSVYDVQVAGVSGDGTVRLDLKSTGTGIVDLAGNAISGGYTAGQSYTIRLPGSGVWISTDVGLWSDETNWEDGVIAEATGATADFSSLDLDGEHIVTLDTPRTLGRLVFGDIDTSTPGQVTVEDQGNAANVLNLSVNSGTPQVVVNATGTGADSDIAAAASATPAILDVGLTSSAGLTKLGLGTVTLTKPATINGPVNVNAGYLEIGSGGSLTIPSLSIAVSSQFHVAGGTFSTTGNVALTNGGVSAIVVSGGTASFNTITPSNGRNGVVRVTGGTMTASSLLIPRSGDAPNMWPYGLVVQGGQATIETVGLGTANSWGAMSVEGGTLNITGPLYVGWQTTGGRGGQMRVLGGVFNSTDPVNGVIMSRKNGTNANNVAQAWFSGGVSTIEKFTLGYDATVNAGSATITVDGGALYLGAGGLVKNGTGGFATTVTLASGLLGAKSDWSSSVDLQLPASNTIALKSADAEETPHAITLTGVLSGAGGFQKTGAGTLVLGGINTFTGPVSVDTGSLVVDGSIVAGSEVAINSGATLGGSGTLARNLVLNTGGTIQPGAGGGGNVLSASSLTWNGGGKIDADLSGTTGRLVLSGALNKGVGGGYTFNFHAPVAPAVGTTFMLATFGSTNFVASDFSYTGLSGVAGTFALNAGILQFTINPQPGAAYLAWIAPYNLPADQAGPTADPDGDGIPNALEFALAQSPVVPGDASIFSTTVSVDNERYPALAFVQRRDVGDLQVVLQVAEALDFSPDLGSVLVSSTERNDGTNDVVIRSLIPLSQKPRQFLRLSTYLPQ